MNNLIIVEKYVLQNNIELILSGAPPPNSTSLLLNNNRFEELMIYARQNYDDIIEKYRFNLNKQCYKCHKSTTLRYDQDICEKKEIVNIVNIMYNTLEGIDLLNKDDIDLTEYRLLKKFCLLKFMLETLLKNKQISSIELTKYENTNNYILLKDDNYYVYLNGKTEQKYYNGLEIKLSKILTKYLKKYIYFCVNNKYLFCQDDRITQLKSFNIMKILQTLFKKYLNKKISYSNIKYIWTN